MTQRLTLTNEKSCVVSKNDLIMLCSSRNDMDLIGSVPVSIVNNPKAANTITKGKKLFIGYSLRSRVMIVNNFLRRYKINPKDINTIIVQYVFGTQSIANFVTSDSDSNIIANTRLTQGYLTFAIKNEHTLRLVLFPHADNLSIQFSQFLHKDHGCSYCNNFHSCQVGIIGFQSKKTLNDFLKVFWKKREDDKATSFGDIGSILQWLKMYEYDDDIIKNNICSESLYFWIVQNRVINDFYGEYHTETWSKDYQFNSVIESNIAIDKCTDIDTGESENDLDDKFGLNKYKFTCKDYGFNGGDSIVFEMNKDKNCLSFYKECIKNTSGKKEKILLGEKHVFGKRYKYGKMYLRNDFHYVLGFCTFGCNSKNKNNDTLYTAVAK